MTKHFLTLLLTLLSVLLFAQNAVTLSGTLDVNTGESFPYKLVITEQDGVVKGFSYTYKEPNDTKATISGRLDRKNRTLTFKETGIVYSGGFHTKAYMCLIDARLDYVQAGKGNVLQGYITSKEADKTACTGGAITFANDAELQHLFSYHEQFDTVISMKKKPKAAPTADAPLKPAIAEAPIVTEKVTAGIVKTYDWRTDTVVIDVWDGGNIDGDRVTIKYNGRSVLTNYFLLKEKKQLRIPVSAQGTDVLTIVADNEGAEPPNTASLMLTDGAMRYSILAYNNKGSECVIRIRKKEIGSGNR